MREIKFRAWDKLAQKMYDWDHIKRFFHRILCDDRVIVMQFTGLYDKFGREIYESDIVRDPLGVAVVHYVAPGFICSDQSNTPYWLGGGKCYPNGYETLHETQILGNVYENPELLPE